MSRPIGSVLRRQVLAQAVVLVVVAVASGVAAVAGQLATDDALETVEELQSLEAMVRGMVDSETAVRGYFIVGRDEFLAPDVRGFESSGRALDGLRESMGDDERLERISILSDEWRTLFADPILRLLEAGRRESAAAQFASGAGKRRIDEIRLLVDAIGDDLRAEQEDRYRQVDRLNLMATVLAVSGAALVLGWSLVLLQRLRREVSEPMHHLAEVADRLGGGDLTAHSYATGVQEVETVSAAINEMAARLERTVEELRALDQMKSEFVSVVSHELRTPLTSIRGSLGLVASGVLGEVPPEAGEMLRIAVSNTDRLVRLINDILDLERMEAGRTAFEPGCRVVADLLEEAASNVAGAADAAGVTLDVRPVSGTVFADPDRVVQALTNLIGNAVKFSPAGSSVEIAAEVGEREVVLRVTDHGRGIPPEQLATVFDRFSQVDASDARELGGTGLGLAIVQQIARQHDGRVEVTSEFGTGSRFEIVLPSVTAPEAPAEEAQGRPAQALALVVEDDRDLRLVIAAQLAQHGVGVVVAASTAEVVAQCVDRLPDVVVLDVRLEQSDGFQVATALRSMPGGGDLPVVVYTAFPLDDDEVERLRVGPTVVIQKDHRGGARLEAAVLEAIGGRLGG